MASRARIVAGIAASLGNLEDLAPLLSPVFAGDPTAPTPSTSDDDTSVATTAFVKAAIAAALAAFVALKPNVEDQTISGGARVTTKDLGTISSGTVTPDPGDRPHQKYTNGGAHTLAPGSNYGSYLLTIVNSGSAGAITTSGWTKVAGDSFTTTNGHKFLCHCAVTADGSVLVVQAMQ